LSVENLNIETVRHHKTISDIALLDLFNFVDITKISQDKFVWDKPMLATVSTCSIDELAHSNGIRIQQVSNVR